MQQEPLPPTKEVAKNRVRSLAWYAHVQSTHLPSSGLRQLIDVIQELEAISQKVSYEPWRPAIEALPREVEKQTARLEATRSGTNCP